MIAGPFVNRWGLYAGNATQASNPIEFFAGAVQMPCSICAGQQGPHRLRGRARPEWRHLKFQRLMEIDSQIFGNPKS